jgi:hypothetical protein
MIKRISPRGAIMTFLLSEISHFGIIMASDSSETRTTLGRTTFVDVEKTHHFPEINVGISTWGHATVGNQGIDEWLELEVGSFVRLERTDAILSDLTEHLAQKLNEPFTWTDQGKMAIFVWDYI